MLDEGESALLAEDASSPLLTIVGGREATGTVTVAFNVDATFVAVGVRSVEGSGVLDCVVLGYIV